MGSLGIDQEWSSEDAITTSNIASFSSTTSTTLPLLSLNHVSYVCKSVADSVRFYVDVLGFDLIKRPSSFKFEGAWLFNYGIGIHLLECEELDRKKSKINPKDNHISFQCTDMKMVIRKLEELKIEYVTALVEEGGIQVDQLFFHDPDGYMVEICNCQNLPVLPLSSCPLQRTPKDINETPMSNTMYNGLARTQSGLLKHCSSEVELEMMETLMTDIIPISL